MSRRSFIAMFAVVFILPCETLLAAPPKTSTITINVRHRHSSGQLVWPASVTVSGPGLYRIMPIRDAGSITVSRTGRYEIKGEYRFNGVTLKATAVVNISKMGDRRNATLLFQ